MSEAILLDTWINQAEAALQAEKWPEALEALQKAQDIAPDHPAILSILGTCCLHLGMVKEARAALEALAQRQPFSAEVYNNLGVALLMDNDPHGARLAFEQALALESTNKLAQKHLALACLQCNDFSRAAPILEALMTTSDEIELRLWLGYCYAGLGKLHLARDLFNQVLQRQPDHPQAQEALRALDNIAQPAPPRPLIIHSPTSNIRNIVFCGSGEVSDFRLYLPARWLKQAGFITQFVLSPTPADLETADVVVFVRPHIRRESMQAIAECVRKGKTLIVDIDDDFHNIPVHHPGYYHCGPGNPNILRALELAIGAAAVLVVSTPILAERYGCLAHRVQVIPNGWDDENPNWEQPGPPRQRVSIGWAGTTTHREDILLVRNELLHFLRSHPEVTLAIGGDSQVFELFKPLPERQKVFLPFRPHNEYPLILANFDILLAPLTNSQFNQAKSDLKLVEAGARRLPWIASPLPAYRAWGVGGILAETPSSWGDALSTLVQDPSLRQQLGAAGRKKSEERNQHVFELWKNMLETL
ncbi:MAG: tetratricopeptide repeat protein [Thermanaerothrix sp.]|nr:tetratricopeptide repeat protein [Thermanaerothrix sp.]